MLATGDSKRPRNVDTPRAAAILYGDWGTSKAYVVGLAFAVAGYSSFWLIVAMCLLTALVGLNYVVICRLYPDGGGVYAAVRHRSEVISIVGAFLLIADYIVTAAISGAFGVPIPRCAASRIVCRRRHRRSSVALNFFGPTAQRPGLRSWISIPDGAIVVVLHWAVRACRYLGHGGIHNMQPAFRKRWVPVKNWNCFV